MSAVVTTELERNNLEAHVDLCAERYRVLESKVNNIENGLMEVRKDIQTMREDMIKSNANTNRIMLGAAATVVAGVLSTIVVLLMSMQ
jgi:predicted  nucleic acid-binding Zn-ribbon protein